MNVYLIIQKLGIIIRQSFFHNLELLQFVVQKQKLFVFFFITNTKFFFYFNV